MATYQSVQTANNDNLGSLTITKPTSLAVGDYMLAGIMVDADGGGTQIASITTPAGWTQESLISPAGTNASRIGVYSKIADSADVAASNFTFAGTGDTGSMTMAGFIARITNWGGEAGQSTNTSTAASTTMTIPEITPSPAVASSLYIVVAGRTKADPGSDGAIAVSIATSNPTWTSRAAVNGNGGTRDTQIGLYTATRTETTATGTYTVTFNGTANVGSGAVALILHPPISGSLIAPASTTYSYSFTGVQSARVTANVADATLESTTPTTWTPIDKS